LRFCPEACRDLHSAFYTTPSRDFALARVDGSMRSLFLARLTRVDRL
jgi:hypothetical protein